MPNIPKVWIFLISLFLVTCAVFEEETTVEEEVPLAEAYNQRLYLSELDGMIPENASTADSIIFIKTYVERWIRKSLLMHKAEKNIPKDLNIDKLVRDYRSSLVRYNYEQQLVKEQMDSVITKQELNEFYEKNREQYQLETPIIRCNFIKVSQAAPDLKNLKNLWQNDTIADRDTLLVAYCNLHAEEFLLTDSVWYKVEDIATRLPKGTLSTENISKRKEISLDDKDYLYLSLIHI